MPAPSDESNETRIAATSASTHIPIANCAPRKRRTRNDTGNRDRGAEERRDDHRLVRAHVVVAEPDRAVGAEADESLLADRDEAAVAGEGVPHRREQHEDQERRHLLGRGLRERDGYEDERDREETEPAGERRPRRGSSAARGSRRRRLPSLRPPRPDQPARAARRERRGTRGPRPGSSTAGRSARRSVCDDPEHDPAHERPPQRPEAADHDRLEGEEELRRAGVGIERRADREEETRRRRRSPTAIAVPHA